MRRPDSFTPVDPVTNADEITRLSCSDIFWKTGRDLRLFTPALLITHGGFDRDPVMEFDARFPATSENLRPVCVDLTKGDERFFQGLGATSFPGTNQVINWDRRLYAIDASREDECFNFLGGFAFSDPKRGFFANVLSYDMEIKDPTSRGDDWLYVKIFGVMANTFVAFLAGNGVKPPVATKVNTTGLGLPLNLPKENLFVAAPSDDPLKMRDE